MKTLLIMRHAKSDWGNAALSDHARPLNPRGHQDAPRMGEWLKKEQLVPDLILSSSAKRAWQTAESVAYASGYNKVPETVDAFYLAGPSKYIERLQQVEDHHQIVMVVGHNPGISELATRMSRSFVQMTTANIVYVRFDIERWADIDDNLTGQLEALWRPKEL